jgi:Kef-type K+ transport system membrane component KefB
VAEKLIIICLLVAGASILPFIARRFNVPSAVLEILFGMFLFHTALHERPEWFEFLKDLGFIYLMFIAGMELDLRALLKNAKVCWYVAIPVLSLILTPAFFYLSGHSFYVGISLSMISAGITFPVLKEIGLVRQDLGRHIVGVTLAGELLSIIALTVLDIAHSYGVSFSLLVQVLKLGALLALATLTLRLIYVIAWWNPDHVRKVMESEDPVEEGIRLAITIVFVGALIAYGAGMEPIMGSFMAGVMFTFVFRNKSRFEEKINALGFGFFIPFFFMGVGADFNIGSLFSVRDIFLAILLAGVIFASNLPALFHDRRRRSCRHKARIDRRRSKQYPYPLGPPGQPCLSFSFQGPCPQDSAGKDRRPALSHQLSVIPKTATGHIRHKSHIEKNKKVNGKKCHQMDKGFH